MATDAKPSLLTRQALCAAACAWMVMALPHHAKAEECSGSVDLTLGEHTIRDNETYEGGNQGCGCQGSSLTGTADGDTGDVTIVEGCRKTEVHKDGDELRSRITTINSDGSRNPQGEDTRAVLNKDQWRTDLKGGSYGQFSGEWPDDKYTRRIPRPSMQIAFAGINKRGNSFSAIFKQDSGNVGRMKNYAEKLKGRGFTIDAKEFESPDHKSYGYHAKNSAGYLVRASCSTSGPCGLTLHEPKEVEKKIEKRKKP